MIKKAYATVKREEIPEMLKEIGFFEPCDEPRMFTGIRTTSSGTTVLIDSLTGRRINECYLDILLEKSDESTS
ncbi:hypothetical protein VOWphi5012_087 [Vibrio phage phi50-12]|uniref:Uncharacterized protein n=1 Tax=Vibrio phage phi50-12 TaxID=2654972 RepID=A0A5P8PRE6_9CAUD|nr:hypothetical protein KNU82_gp087 [Vibrio phage phi50-12]QFR59870.1 hypothetical protein VOWphi5012_087 [Vibrio phage phi50-12]